MRKNILPFILVFSVVTLKAQTTEFDAIKSAQTDIIGTARYMGMAGAFGALGGDASAIKDNPAGLGVYRSSEITTTFNFQTQTSKSTWDNRSSDDDLFKAGFNNFSLALSSTPWAAQNGSSTGLQQSNWAFSYNRLKNFNRNSTVKGNAMGTSVSDYLAGFTNGIHEDYISNEYAYDDVNIPWMSILAYDGYLINFNNDPNYTWSPTLFSEDMSTPNYNIREQGHMDEYSLSWGGNFSNVFYLGAAVNYQTSSYTMNSQYEERFRNNSERLNLSNYLNTYGYGFNFNIGVIVRPVNFLRLGVSLKTPTNMRFNSIYYGDLYTEITNNVGDFVVKDVGTPKSEYKYQIRIPGKVTASAAFILGKRAIISGDFIYTNYKKIKMFDDDNGAVYYEEDNEAIRNTFNNGMMVKIGAEYRITDNLSVRAGMAAETASMKSSASKEHHLNTTRTDPDFFRHRGTNYFTAGIGYRGNYWYFDAAFVNKNLTEDFMPYSNSNIAVNNRINPATVKTHNYDIVATVGLRF